MKCCACVETVAISSHVRGHHYHRVHEVACALSGPRRRKTNKLGKRREESVTATEVRSYFQLRNRVGSFPWQKAPQTKNRSCRVIRQDAHDAMYRMRCERLMRISHVFKSRQISVGNGLLPRWESGHCKGHCHIVRMGPWVRLS